MNVDNFISIGRNHKICEDYSIVGMDPIPYLIVSDGCSSSKDTDVGARILALCARFIIQTYSIIPNKNDFGNLVFWNAKDASDVIGLDKHALDCTLIVSFIIDNEIITYIYGDGVIVKKYTGRDNEFIDTEEISFSLNMPYYLSYLLDESTHSEYLKSDNKMKATSFYGKKDLGPLYLETEHIESRIIIADDLEFFGLMSDGASAFKNLNTNTFLPTNEVTEELFAFKNHKGKFVQRRMIKALKQYQDSNIFPFDDISIAVMSFKE